MVKVNRKIENRITPVLLNYGGARKFITDMSVEELQAARESILRRAKEKAFSKGLPIYYLRKGNLLAEHPDGSVEIVRR